MIVRFKLKKPFNTTKLLNFSNLYAVESEVKSTYIIADKKKLAVVKCDDVIECCYDEVPRLASMFKTPLKEEILGVYEDIMDLKYWNLKVI